MNPTLLTVLVCLVAGLAFAGVRWLLAGRIDPARPTSVFWVDLLSFAAGLIVFALRSFLGVPLS